MKTRAKETELRPDGLIDAILGYRKAKTLITAASLGVFDRLEGPKTARALAAALGLDARGAEILLDALTALGYVEKRADLYCNAPLASRFLVAGRPGYLGDNLKYQEIIWDAWGELGRCVKKGGAVRPLGHWLKRKPGFAREYIRGMDNIAQGPAAEIAEALSGPPMRRLLDVGAGPGAYARALLRRAPGLSAVLLDLPGSLRVTREVLRGHPDLAGRVSLKAGDYRSARFGREEFDLVLLSHITHDESPAVNRRLLRESFRALRPGGRVVIHDFLVDDARTQPLFGALFSVHMLAYTRGGRTYTAAEYENWLREAGFTGLWRRKIGINLRNSTEILVATK